MFLYCKVGITSCARGDTICVRPLQVDNIFAFIRQVAVLFQHNNIFVFICHVAPVPACWVFKNQQQVDRWSFDLESGVRVTCDVGYLRANFSLLRPLCSRVRPDVCDRQTDVRQKHRLMTPPYDSGGIIMVQAPRDLCYQVWTRRLTTTEIARQHSPHKNFWPGQGAWLTLFLQGKKIFI